MKHFVASVAVVCGVALMPAALAAQQANTPPATPQTQPSTKSTETTKPGMQGTTGRVSGALAPADATFVRKAAIGGLAEVEFGRIASEHGSNADVKQFGSRMVTDHGKANDDLKQLAQQKHITLPTDLDAANRRERDRLAKLSGDALDRAYMRAMVRDHQMDVSAFKKASQTAKDSDLKAWAAKTLPTLEEHLKLAKDTEAKVAPARRTAKRPAAETGATAPPPQKTPVNP